MKVLELKALAIGRTPCYWPFAVICILLAGGCQRGVYRASNLPAELQAPPNISIHSLDLSKIGTSTSSSEIIQTGDVLKIAMATGLENRQEELTEWPLRVADDGTANVPLVGQVYLAGLPLSEADQIIRRASVERGLFRNPNVAVRVQKPQSNKISVVGAVEEPGTYELPVANSNLLSAITAAGGPSEDADTIIEIRHPPQFVPRRHHRKEESGGVTTAGMHGTARPLPARTQRLDLVAATVGESTNLNLEDGAIVMVMKRPLRAVYVTGLVHKPDQYTMPSDRDLYLLDAVSMAGGRVFEIADKITVIRRNPGSSEPILIRASHRNAVASEQENIRLAPGDVIQVDETPITLSLKTLRSFIRVGISGSLPLF